MFKNVHTQSTLNNQKKWFTGFSNFFSEEALLITGFSHSATT